MINKGLLFEQYVVSAWNGTANNIENDSLFNIAKTAIGSIPPVNCQAVSLGASYAISTEKWKSHFSYTVNKPLTYKTDVLIGKYKISIKFGSCQLMSGNSQEAIATFVESAIECNFNETDIIGIKNMLAGLASYNVCVGNVRNALKKGDDIVLKDFNTVNKIVMEHLTGIFNDRPDYKAAVLHEAISGNHKFGASSPAAANSMLSVAAKGKIHFSTDVLEYANSIMNSTKLQIRFKTDSLKTTVNGVVVNTGNYQYRSVVALCHKNT